jgi:cytochrome P450
MVLAASPPASVGSTPAAPLAPLFVGHPLFGVGPLFQKRPIQTLFEIAESCGDVGRLRFPLKPYMAHLVRHPDHLRRIFIDEAKNYGKQTRGYDRLRDLLGAGLVTSEGDFWKRQRRIANPAFHRARIAQFAEVMVRCGTEMVDGWRPRIESGEAFDVAAEMMRVTLRIIGLTMLSTDVDGRASSVRDAVDALLHITIRRIQGLLLVPPWVPTAENRRFASAKGTLDAIVHGMIADRRRSGRVGDDLLGMLMAARDPETGESMSDAQLRDEAMTVFLAGHETTANALTWSLYYLSLHPEAAAALGREVRSVCGDRPPRLEDLEKLTYTERVIKESMRLRPPVWVLTRSVNEDDVLGGYRIPKGTWVFASPYLTHRDARFWPNPEGFDPDRFSPEQEAKRPKHAYWPFLMGPRMCIGEAFAMLEARLVLALVVQRVRLDLVAGRVVDLDPVVTLRPKGGLWMTASIPALPVRGRTEDELLGAPRARA